MYKWATAVHKGWESGEASLLEERDSVARQVLNRIGVFITMITS